MRKIPSFFAAVFLLISIGSANNDFPYVSNADHGSELEIVRPFLPEYPVILEAGAHRGEDTVRIYQNFPTATIYAFEPCPEYYRSLKKAVKHNPNIHAFPFGLFSKSGYYTFHLSKTIDGASSLFEDNHLVEGPEYNDVPVDVYCMNLDEWALKNRVDHIDYMWLDMEGAEFDVLAASPMILKTLKAVSCEVNFCEYREGMCQFDKIRSLFEDNGFVFHAFWGSVTAQGTAVFIREDLLSK